MESAGSSNSDITTIDDKAPNVNIRRLKRKVRSEEDIAMLFEKFTLDIDAKLNSFNSDLGSKIYALQQDINTVIKQDLESIKVDIKNINIKQSEFHQELNGVKDALNFQNNEHKDLEKRVQKIETGAKVVGGDCEELRADVSKLQSELNILQQRERAENIEMSGIPERSNENLLTTIKKIGEYVGVQLSDSDVIHITRIQPRIKTAGRPKNIIVKFRTRLIRDSMLSGVRAKKGLSTSDIGIPGDSKKVYINEHLTPSNKVLHKNTREKCKAKNFQYCWIRDGKIFVRKNDTSSALLIQNAADLKKII